MEHVLHFVKIVLYSVEISAYLLLICDSINVLMIVCNVLSTK